MNVKIIGKTKDYRTDTNVIYAQVSIQDYLKLIGDNFDDFSIQRRRQKYKAYDRMKQDIIQGALLPTITLAVKPDKVSQLVKNIDNDDKLSSLLNKPGNVNILDGLQRTYILKDLEKEGVIFNASQTLNLEYWLESNTKHLVYRIIVLNAGQKPMSMRHQVELLFMTLKELLQNELNIELFTERGGARRNKARKYSLDKVVAGYQCFITKSPEITRENLVATKLVEADVFDSSEEELDTKFNQYKAYLSSYADLDDEICRVYAKGKIIGEFRISEDESVQEKGIPTGISWFGSDNVVNSFFAALSEFGSIESRLPRIKVALKKLKILLENAAEGDDPLGLVTLTDIMRGFNPRKVNVGVAQRKLLTSGFKEFFREEGEVPLQDCWLMEAK